MVRLMIAKSLYGGRAETRSENRTAAFVDVARCGGGPVPAAPVNVISFAGIFAGGMLYRVLAPSYQAEMKVLVRRGRVDPVDDAHADPTADVRA